jgi:hypothetical protein
MFFVLVSLLFPFCFAELHESPYWTSNKTVCPGRFDNLKNYLPCNRLGQCNEVTGECECFQQYRGVDCSYTLKSRRTAFLLSFLIGTWGAGRLYLGWIGMGILQLVGFGALLSLPCFPLCCMCVTTDRAKLRRLHRVVLALCAVGMVSIVAWWIFDWLYILLAADDVYGFDLQSDLKSIAIPRRGF